MSGLDTHTHTHTHTQTHRTITVNLTVHARRGLKTSRRTPLTPEQQKATWLPLKADSAGGGSGCGYQLLVRIADVTP